MKTKVSSWLYGDKDLNNPLTKEQVVKAQDGKVVYFYDGNNGDKHIVVGHTLTNSGNVDTVLAINISQNHMTGRYSCFSNANQVVTNLKMPTTGSELVNLFNNVRVLNW